MTSYNWHRTSPYRYVYAVAADFRTLHFNIFLQRVSNSNLLTAVLVVCLVVDEFDVRKRKMSNFAVQLALPLAVNVRFRYFYYVSDFQLQGRLVVGIGYARLLDLCERRKSSLDVGATRSRGLNIFRLGRLCCAGTRAAAALGPSRGAFDCVIFLLVLLYVRDRHRSSLSEAISGGPPLFLVFGNNCEDFS